MVALRARPPFDPQALLNWLRAIRPFAFRTRASATFFSRHPEVTIADDCFSIIERAHFMKPKPYFAAKGSVRRLTVRPLRWEAQTASLFCDSSFGDSRAAPRSVAAGRRVARWNPNQGVSVIAGMTYRSYQEIELCRTAFLIAWRALLREKRLRAKNMETLPGQLMTAIMLVAMTADGNAERVAEAALSRMEFYEREGRGEFAVPLAH